MYFEISNQKELRSLGLHYEPDVSKCRVYMSSVSFKQDYTTKLWYTHKDMEKNSDDILKNIIRRELGMNNIKSVNKIWWYRIFLFPNMNYREFKACYYFRVLGVG